MKLPGFIKNIYLSGFPREGLITAFVDDQEEVEYKKLRSNSNIFNNSLVRIRVEFHDEPQEFELKGRFGDDPLRVSMPRCQGGTPAVDEGSSRVRTSVLYRGKNVFTIEKDGEKWPLIIYHKTLFRDWVEGLARAVILIVGLNTFVIQGSYIPSASMMNTLIEGDYIWVNKAAYYFQEPQRGDVVVFNFPLDPTRDFIKRLIGLPGDQVEVRNKVLYLNGKPIREDYTLLDFMKFELDPTVLFRSSTRAKIPQGACMVAWSPEYDEMTSEGTYLAMNPGVKKGETVDLKQVKKGRFRLPLKVLALEGDELTLTDKGLEVDQVLYRAGTYRLFGFESPGSSATASQMPPFTIPADSFFVLGDNRDNSQDSRFWGTVPRANLKGRAFFLYWPFDRMKSIKRKVVGDSAAVSNPSVQG